MIFNIAYSQNKEIGKKRYYVESGYIKYKISGNTTGTEEIYFDKWGEKERKITKTVTKTTFYGVTNTKKENSMHILNGDVSYGIDLKNKTGVKTLNAGVTTMSAMSTDRSPRTMSKEMLKKMGGKKIGEGEILGKKCEIWKALGTKLWIWKGIPLKISTKMLGIERTTEAVEMRVDIPIKDDKFEVPADIKIVDYTNEPRKK